jgi:hypothetical protein
MEREREKYDSTILVKDNRRPEYKNKGWMKGRSLHTIVKQEKMPIHLLPNVRSFKISLRTMDYLFNLFGIDRRHKPIIRIERLSSRNEAMNRYVVYQFHRMNKLKKRGWHVGELLIKKSQSFRIMALNHVIPG